jgi:hypothetical protein
MSQLKEQALKEALFQIAELREKMNLLVKDLFWQNKEDTRSWLAALIAQNNSEQCAELGLNWTPTQLNSSLQFLIQLEKQHLHLLQWKDYALLLYNFFPKNEKIMMAAKKLVSLDEITKKCWLCPEEFNSIHAEKALLYVEQIKKGLSQHHPVFEKSPQENELAITSRY